MKIGLSQFAFLVQHSEDFRIKLERKLQLQAVNSLDMLVKYTEEIMSEKSNKKRELFDGLELFGIEFKKITPCVGLKTKKQSDEYETYYFTQEEYSKKFHKYGSKEFCYFSDTFLGDLPTDSGVYCWVFDGEPVYIGECDNLKNRMRMYGKLTISSCHYQSTDCKMNSEILRAVKQGKRVDLFFYKTESHDAVEQYILGCKNFLLNKKDN